MSHKNLFCLFAATLLLTFAAAPPGFMPAAGLTAAAQQNTVEELAGKIAAAQSEEERQRLLSDNPTLVTPELVRALLRHAAAARGGSDFARSLSIATAAQGVAVLLGDQRENLLGAALVEQAFAHTQQENGGKALELLVDAQRHAAAGGDRSLKSKVEAARAEVFLNQGLFAEALEAAEKAVAEAPPDDHRARGDAYFFLGRARGELALHRESFTAFDAAIKAYAQAGMPEKAIPLLNEEAIHYSDTGEPDKSIPVYDRMLDLLGPPSDANRPRRVMTLINKGLDQAMAGQAQSGVDTIRGAIQQIRKGDPDVISVAAHLNLALALDKSGNLSQAREEIQKAYDLAVASNQERAKLPLNRVRLQWSRILLANDNATPEEVNRAIKLAEEAHGATRREDLEGQWLALLGKGNAYFTAGMKKEALEAFSGATRIIDSIVNEIGDDPETIASYLADKIDIYGGVATLLAEDGRKREGLIALEKGRARGLLSVVERGHSQARQGMNTEEREGEALLKARLAVANREALEAQQNPSLPKAVRDARAAKLESTRAEWMAQRLRLSRAYPGIYSTPRPVTPLADADLPALIADKDTAVLEYILNKTDAMGFVITRTASGEVEVQSFSLDGPPATLRQTIEDYQRAVSSGRGGYVTPGEDLYKRLVAPAASHLLGKGRLIIVPDGALWQVPFQSLVLPDGRFLVEKYAISYVPSLSVLRELRQKPPFSAETGFNNILALANPAVTANPGGRAAAPVVKSRPGIPVTMSNPLEPLPKIQQQAEKFGRQVGRRRARVYPGSLATEMRFRADAPRATTIYFAAHGVANNDAPLYSRIVLTPTGNETNSDGLIEAWELLEMRIPASLVILAACESAGGRVKSGEGMIGLSWAFAIAGVPRLVASQWKVPEESTAPLMDTMLRRLFGLDDKGRRVGGAIPPDLALRVAVLEIIKNPATKEPWHWAAFQVIGDSR